MDARTIAEEILIKENRTCTEEEFEALVETIDAIVFKTFIDNERAII